MCTRRQSRTPVRTRMRHTVTRRAFVSVKARCVHQLRNALRSCRSGAPIGIVLLTLQDVIRRRCPKHAHPDSKGVRTLYVTLALMGSKSVPRAEPTGGAAPQDSYSVSMENMERVPETLLLARPRLDALKISFSVGFYAINLEGRQ